MESSNRIGWTTATKSYDYGFTEELEVLEDFDIYGFGPPRTYRKVSIQGRYSDIENQISRYFSGLGGFQEEDPRQLQLDFNERQAKGRAEAEADKNEFEAVLQSEDLEVKKQYYSKIRFSSSIYADKIKLHISEFEDKVKLIKLNEAISKLPPVPEVVAFFRMKDGKYGKYVLSSNITNDIHKELHEAIINGWTEFKYSSLEFAGIGWTALHGGSKLNGGVRVYMSEYVDFISLQDREDNNSVDRTHTYFTRYIGPTINPDMMQTLISKGFKLQDMLYCFIGEDLFWCAISAYNMFSSDISTKQFLVFDSSGQSVKGNSKAYKAVKEHFVIQRFRSLSEDSDVVFYKLADCFEEIYKKELAPWLNKFWCLRNV